MRDEPPSSSPAPAPFGRRNNGPLQGSTANLPQDLSESPQNLTVAEAHHPVPGGDRHFLPPDAMVPLPLMHRPIDLHHQMPFGTTEIGQDGSDRMLPPKFQPAWASGAQRRLQSAFRQRLSLSQLPRRGYVVSVRRVCWHDGIVSMGRIHGHA